MIILYLLVYMGKFSEMGRELKSLWIFLLNQGIISSSTSPCRHVLGPHVGFKISPYHMPLRSPCRSLYSIKRQPGSPLFLELCSKNTVTGCLLGGEHPITYFCPSHIAVICELNADGTRDWKYPTRVSILFPF